MNLVEGSHILATERKRKCLLREERWVWGSRFRGIEILGFDKNRVDKSRVDKNVDRNSCPRPKDFREVPFTIIALDGACHRNAVAEIGLRFRQVVQPGLGR